MCIYLVKLVKFTLLFSFLFAAGFIIPVNSDYQKSNVISLIQYLLPVIREILLQRPLHKVCPGQDSYFCGNLDITNFPFTDLRR